MCGIFGLVGEINISNDQLLNSCQEFLGNRGPDGLNFIRKENLYLCHSRLAINDLTDKGIQPFRDKKGNIISVTNGEIYNNKELRINEKIILDTSNDCAIIPELFRKKGIESLSDLNGMFASAIADLDNQRILITRDINGIKPLYYLETENFLAFSSSAQQLSKLFNFNSIDSLALSLFLVLKYIPAPMSGFSKIKKLMPGEIRTYSLNGKYIESKNIRRKSIKLTKNTPNNTRLLIRNSVKEHLESDVKISSLLSGGLDSSIITFEAKELLGNIDTYTAFQNCYKEDQDVYHSSILCKKLGIKNNLIKIPFLDLKKISSPLKLVSEPCADPAFITGYYLIKEIKKSNKVLLSGDGADELFGGYGINERFNLMQKNSKFWHLITELISNFDKEYLPNIIYKNKLTKKLLKGFDSSINFNLLFLSLYSGLPISLIKIILPENILRIINMPDHNLPFFIQEYELNELMPNYFLNKVDSMSMLNSVEIRNPFISGSIRSNYFSYTSNHYSSKKQFLTESYKNLLPDEILFRKKLGFTRDLNIFRDNKIWREFSNQISLDYFDFNKLPLRNLLQFSMNNTSEAYEIRWRIFTLLIWLSGNKLIEEFDFKL